MHSTLFLCLFLVIAVLALAMIAHRFSLSLPIFLVIGGLCLSLVPGIPVLRIDPDIVFLILLPPILYEAAWFTSWKEFWKFRRIISVLAFGFVLLTSFAVASISTAIIPGFTLALGFLLGAIISPPDAVAATSVLKGVNVSKSMVGILEGESLVNDAASLVIFRFAIAAVLTGSFVWQQAAMSFFVVIISGIAIGLAIALFFYMLYRWISMSTQIAITLTFVAPYLMYLVAEQFHSSGVMAVVSGGLLLSSQSHRYFTHETRLQGAAIWSTIVFVLNGLAFILIGLEFPIVIQGLKNYSSSEALSIALIITASIIIVRMAAAQFASLFTRFAGRYIQVAEKNPGWKGPIIIGWAGMRGVVSLASALSIPLTAASGQDFPYRDLILFVTFVVILITLVGQGLTLPWIVKLLNLKERDGHKTDYQQETEMQLHLMKRMLDELERRHHADQNQNKLMKNKVAQIKNDVELLQMKMAAGEEFSHSPEAKQYRAMISDLLSVQRKALWELQHNEAYDDDVVRKLESLIDLEEDRITRVQQKKP